MSGPAGTGTDSILSFFAEGAHAPVSGFDADWEPTETLYAEAPNGFPVIAVTFQPPAEDGEDGEEPADEETVTLFAFFDAGAPLFPGNVFIIIAVLGFILHAFMLNADERREQRELAEVVPEEQEKVPAGA